MSLNIFSVKKTQEDLIAFRSQWLNSVTNTLLPLLRTEISSSSAVSTVVSTNFDFAIRHLNSYFDTLIRSANDNTILDLIFPPWRNSQEMPILLLGEIHPHLLTSLLRSLAAKEVKDYDSLGIIGDLDLPTWSNSESLMTRIDEIDREMQPTVTSLLGRMTESLKLHVEKYVDAVCHKEKLVDEDLIKELIDLCVGANNLRKQVLNDIVGAMNSRQKPLFLEALCEILLGSKDQNLASASASGSSPFQQPPKRNTYCIFVGDLSPDVTGDILLELFRSRFPSTKSARVIMDNIMRINKGYGFVGFEDQRDQLRALEEMNGVVCTTRPMRVGMAKDSSV